MRSSRSATARFKEKVRALSRAGVAGTDVAKLCGITPRDVYAVLNETPVDRGKRAAKRRALWAQQRRDGLSLAEIARRSGVSPTAVREGLKRAACKAAEGVAS